MNCGKNRRRRKKMEIKLTISEEALSQAVMDVLVKDAVDTAEQQLFDDGCYGYMRKVYKDHVQTQMREMLKRHETEILDRAISEAAKIVARKAWAIKAGEIG